MNIESETLKSNNAWEYKDVENLYSIPFISLLYNAQRVHRENFDPDTVQLSTLLSIKTGKCSEDCAYCPQSSKYKTNIQNEDLWDIDDVIERAKIAKENKASRFCMGAAGRRPSKKDLARVIDMIKAIKELGLETCVTLGTLSEVEAKQLKEAGLDYYNHNIDTSREYYKKIITTRPFDERLDTLRYVRDAGLKTCCGGIIGMGESRDDRIKFLCELANMEEPPQSVPINRLISVKGTPLGNKDIKIDNIEFIKTIAIARIIMPKSVIRLSAGRSTMSEETQSLCFMAGCNSIFYGDKLLTTPNPSTNKDLVLFDKLGIKTN